MAGKPADSQVAQFYHGLDQRSWIKKQLKKTLDPLDTVHNHWMVLIFCETIGVYCEKCIAVARYDREKTLVGRLRMVSYGQDSINRRARGSVIE